MKSMKLHFAATMLLLLFPPVLSAAEAPPVLDAGAKPIEVTADRLRAENGGAAVIFEGNVAAKQGDVTMYSDTLRAEYSKQTNTIEQIEAEGNVRFLQEDKEVTSKKAMMFNMEQRVVFSGEAVLRQGGNTVHGETVTVFLRENRATVKGSEDGGRVNAVIYPKDVKEAKQQ